MDHPPTPVASSSTPGNGPTQFPTPNQILQTTLNPASQRFVPTQPVTGLTTTTQSLTYNQKCSPACLLKTAIAFVKTDNHRVSANILFDEGAQRTFITQALANQLDSSPHYRENLAISSFGGDTTSKYQVDTFRIILETNDGDVAISALVVPQIAAPAQNLISFNLHKLPHLQTYKWPTQSTLLRNFRFHF